MNLAALTVLVSSIKPSQAGIHRASRHNVLGVEIATSVACILTATARIHLSSTGPLAGELAEPSPW